MRLICTIHIQGDRYHSSSFDIVRALEYPSVEQCYDEIRQRVRQAALFAHMSKQVDDIHRVIDYSKTNKKNDKLKQEYAFLLQKLRDMPTNDDIRLFDEAFGLYDLVDEQQYELIINNPELALALVPDELGVKVETLDNFVEQQLKISL